jgi:BTB/POZ domain
VQHNPTTVDTFVVSLAEAPFNDSNANIILRSSDGVLFYVHNLLLSLVSPFFSTMFTLPTSLDSQDIYDSRPCIAVSDDAKHLRVLLSSLDPRCTQLFNNTLTRPSDGIGNGGQI